VSADVATAEVGFRVGRGEVAEALAPVNAIEPPTRIANLLAIELRKDLPCSDIFRSNRHTLGPHSLGESPVYSRTIFRFNGYLAE
jgi:hypothetical protein